MKTSVWEHFKNRVVWLVLLALLGLVSGMIVQNFEGLLLQFAILATFMPMLADTGGNTGSQASTLVVRALALQEVKPRDIFRVLFKEGLVSVMLGTVLAALAFGRVFLFAGQSGVESGMPLSRIGLAVALALGLQVVSSTLIGALLPLSVAKFKIDPADVASPALTTIVDITGLLIFFSTARIILGM
jgi:magnesium transporter